MQIFGDGVRSPQCVKFGDHHISFSALHLNYISVSTPHKTCVQLNPPPQHLQSHNHERPDPILLQTMQIIRVSVLVSFLAYAAATSIPVKRGTYTGVCDPAPYHISNVLSADFSNNSASLMEPVTQGYATTILMRVNPFRCPATPLFP